MAVPLIPWAEPPYDKRIVGGRFAAPPPVWPPLWLLRPELFGWPTAAPVDLYDYHWMVLVMRAAADQANKKRKEAAEGEGYLQVKRPQV